MFGRTCIPSCRHKLFAQPLGQRVITQGPVSSQLRRSPARSNRIDHRIGGGGRLAPARAFWRRKKRNSRDVNEDVNTTENVSATDVQADAAASRESVTGSMPESRMLEASSSDPVARMPIVVALTVQEGDTLESLAKSIGIDTDTLITANGGVRDVKPGDQLTWQLPMPADPRELLQLMGQTEGGTLGSRQAVTSSPVLSTLRRLPPVVVFGAAGLVLLGLWRLSQTMSQQETAALRRRAALNRRRMGKETASDTTGEASEAESLGGLREEAASIADERTSAQSLGRHSQESTSGSSHGGTVPASEPEWLGLPLVHFMQLPGNQFPSFLLQPQAPNEYSWLVFEDRRDAEALQQWFISNGKATLQSRVNSMFPLAFLGLAESQSRGVSFVPTGSLRARPELAEEDLWVEIMGAAAHLPLKSTAGSAASVSSIISERFGKDPTISSELGSTQPQVAIAEPSSSTGDQTPSPLPEELGREASTDAFTSKEGAEASDSSPLGSTSAAEASPSDRTKAAVGSQTEALGEESRPSAGIDQESAAFSPGSPSQADDGAATSRQDEAEPEPPELDRDGQYAAMAEAMMAINEVAQPPKEYVPKSVRNFVKGFAQKEQAFQAAAAADPNFKPLEAAEQLEREEIAAIMDPRPPGPSAEDLDDRSLVYGTLGEQQVSKTPNDEEKESEQEEGSSTGESASAGGGDPGADDDSDFRAELRRLWEEAGRRAREGETAENITDGQQSAAQSASSSGSLQTAGSADRGTEASTPAKPVAGWWQKLAAVYLLEAEAPDGGSALLSVDIAISGEPENVHVIGFADSQDALKFMGLYVSRGLGECSVVVRTPAQLLADGIGGSASGLTVYRRRQLPLTPDLSERDLTNLLIGYAR